MIRTFHSPATERLFRREKGGFPSDWEHRMFRKLMLLDSAVRLSDLRTQCVEALSGGTHKGYHRIQVAPGWSLFFWWMDGDAYKVEIHVETSTDTSR